MSDVLGVHCSPKAVYFAVVSNGSVVATGPQRIEIPEGLRYGESILALVGELRRRLAEVHAGRGALLAPQSYDGGPKAISARAGAEALVRLTAAEMGLELEVLNRASARSRLGIDRAGALDDHIAVALPEPVGKYWSEGRRYAAFAALACERMVA